jgi:hypothetical protein
MPLMDEIQHQVEVAGHMIGRGRLRLEGKQLVVMFTVSGPEASPRFPKEHVVLVRPGDSEKLDSLGGFGGQETESSAAFFEWRFDWPGGAAVDVIYLDEGDHIVQRERVAL